MLDIGKELKTKRKERGLSLEEVNEQTKITIEHLRLLEANEFAFLPPTYVKSFIKNYAKALDVDGDALVDEFDRSLKIEKRQEEEREQQVQIRAQQSPGKQKAIEWSLGVGLIALLASLIFGYIEYKSRVSLHTGQVLNYLKKQYGLAELAVEKKVASENGITDSILDVQITAKEKIWVRLIVDNKQRSEITLYPAQVNSWQARDRLEIVIGKWTNIKTPPADSNGHIASDKNIHLTITESSFRQRNRDEH